MKPYLKFASVLSLGLVLGWLVRSPETSRPKRSTQFDGDTVTVGSRDGAGKQLTTTLRIVGVEEETGESALSGHYLAVVRGDGSRYIVRLRQPRNQVE